MKPIQTPECNSLLTLAGDKTGRSDLPALRCAFFDEAAGEKPDQAAEGFETYWVPSELEREEVAGGGQVILRIWGKGHPPVSVTTAAPEERLEVLDRGHVNRALGLLYATLQEFGLLVDDPDSVDPMTPPKFLETFEDALARTNQPPGDGATIEVPAERRTRDNGADPDA